MRKEGRPRHVLDAMHDQNRAALSAMGKKGAEVRELRKEIKEEKAARDREEMVAEQAQLYSEIDGEILPPEFPDETA
jgi:hypothetical protein